MQTSADPKYSAPFESQSGVTPDESQTTVVEEWEPSGHQKAIIYVIGVLNLIVALDASVIVTSLAVSVFS
jgi:hypothetical protein